MVKRKMKKAIKQKQKQNVNVKQNVKVVVGEIKKKRAVKSSGAKSGAGAKPPIILNISQPQPYNNPYMEYFKNQLQNKEPVKANTLAQYEKLNEREENKASKVGLLHNLDKEPDDVARELRRQKVADIARFQQAEAEKKAESEAISKSIKFLPKEPKETKKPPKQNKPQLTPQSTPQIIEQREPAIVTPESIVMMELEEQQARLEREMEKQGGAGEENIPLVEAPPQQEEFTIVTKKRGRKKGGTNRPKEVIQAERHEKEKIQLEKQAQQILKMRAKAMSPK